jgi:hypothetical protein
MLPKLHEANWIVPSDTDVTVYLPRQMSRFCRYLTNTAYTFKSHFLYYIPHPSYISNLTALLMFVRSTDYDGPHYETYLRHRVHEGVIHITATHPTLRWWTDDNIRLVCIDQISSLLHWKWNCWESRALFCCENVQSVWWYEYSSRPRSVFELRTVDNVTILHQHSCRQIKHNYHLGT